jgi:uncharacterized membrane protein YhaH (DUF805 family)
MQNNGIIGLLTSYSGRINRGKYWLAAVIYIAISILLAALGFIMLGNGILALSGDDAEGLVAGLISKGIGFFLIALIVWIAIAISGVFVGIKRLHDRDKSGWWLVLFYLVPSVLSGLSDQSVILPLAGFAISVWAFVELGCLRGTVGPNKYGPDPLGAVAYQPSGA